MTEENLLTYEQAIHVLAENLRGLGVGLLEELTDIIGEDVTDIHYVFEPTFQERLTDMQRKRLDAVRRWFEETAGNIDHGIALMVDKYDKQYEQVIEDSCNILGLSPEHVLAIIQVQNDIKPTSVTVH